MAVLNRTDLEQSPLADLHTLAADLGIEGFASATWTSAARTEEARIPGYARETFAFLYYLLAGS